MQYAKLSPDLLSVEGVRDLDPQYLATLAPNKQALFRPLVFDTKPTPGATQVVVDVGYVIEPTQVRYTYSLREKTADELEGESLDTDRAQIAAALDAINTQLAIDATAFNAMTAAQRAVVQRDDRAVLLRVARYFVRRIKRGL